jgi:diguanylate cyclase (GGDEF)-like protein
MMNLRWKKYERRFERRLEVLERLEKMITELHACRTFAEAYGVIAHFAQLLLPGVGGALFLRDNGMYECVRTWRQFQPGKRRFVLEECTALQRMKAHLVEDSHGPGCPHVVKATGRNACLPLMWAGQALGVLHLQTLGQHDRADVEPPLKMRLAEKIAGHCAQKLGELHEHKTLTEQAVRDPLTGLFNRRYMEESLRRELAVRGRKSLGVIMLDIDHFKRFNTKFTHSGGDALLHSFGGFLQQHIRRADVACRFGGEEFVLILPGATHDDARRRAEEIRRDVRSFRAAHHDQPLGRIKLSLGVAASKTPGSSAEKLLEAATRALRRAKRTGRNRVSVSAT